MKMRTRIFLFLCMMMCVVVFAATPLRAQTDVVEFDRDIPLLRLWAQYNSYAFPRDLKEASEVVRNYKGPVEPKVPEVTFYEFDSPQHLQGRIDGLLHGIKITLPPEYDHYGYEVRRFMNSVGRIQIYSNRYAIEDELVNIEKAWVVFRYWREALIAEIEAIDEGIKADATTGSKVKTMFNVNQAVVKAFIIEMQAWLNANQALLTFLADNRKLYAFEQGNFVFKSSQAASQFVALFGARERAKLEMREYDPFGKIVY
ncbi:MAG: hypothetical protein CL570_05805 [Alphaproteobacteria bacterium]|nr:hypothetical protein [Alphaproteobacteria bacterium]HCQ70591.1 hypothetical protein [Rhodospirillaceae bacterium]|tara:strand:- start:36338 stop:37111 length:774 start_codon:yes stop_codon:yes gene_type:complete